MGFPMLVISVCHGSGLSCISLCPLTAYFTDLLASLTYSHRNKSNGVASKPPACTDRVWCRVHSSRCDLLNFYFMYDEYTDVSGEATAYKLANIVLSAMHHPLAPSQPTVEEHVLGQINKEQVS